MAYEAEEIPTAVLQRDQCAFSIKVQSFIADTVCIVIIIHVEQTHCINLTHLLPPPVLSEPAGNCSGSEDSSP